MAGGITRADGEVTPAPRAAVDVTVVVGAGGEQRPVTTTLSLFGPGEVAAIDPRAVVRVAPKPGELDAEPNELPMVEFAEPDLPWRFTAATSGAHDRLRPWLVLCVLTADEITDEVPAGADGRLPAVMVTSAAALPRLDQSWAWAHAQVSAYDPASETLAAIVDSQPSRARSRLLAPRHLRPHTEYTALLVPAFERGRLAGLREPVADAVDSLAPAWADGATAVRLPVYYRWSFQTGDQADFEQLARRLTGRVVDADVGVFGLDARTADPALPSASTQLLTGTAALTSPNASPGPWPTSERGPFVAALAAMLNQPADALNQDGGTRIVAPPLWGRWHAAVDRLDLAAGARPAWFHELNADPRLRVVAGLGAEVVRRNDEQLMAAAWDQVEGIIAANAQLRRAQLAREASVRLMANHLATLDGDTLLHVTSPVHARVATAPAAPSSSPTATPRAVTSAVATVHERFRASPVPAGALDGQLRRLRRRTGSSLRAQPSALATAPVGGLLDRLNRLDVRPRPPVPTPEGMLILQREAPPGRLPNWDVSSVVVVSRGTVVATGATSFTSTAPAAVAEVVSARPINPGPGPVPPPPPVPPPLPPPPPPGQPGSASWRPGAAGSVLGQTNAPVHRPMPVGGDPRVDPTAAAAVVRFRQAFTSLSAVISAPPASGPVLVQADLPALTATLMSTLDPRVTIADGVRHRLQIAPWVIWGSADPLEPVMAAPEFDTPMYKPLADLGHDWLLPGAGTIPADTVTLVRSNQRFVEAYLLGLSHEMARELLFHEYPTDQRGTYFRQFWDVRGAVAAGGTPIDPQTLHDITPIHRWDATQGLGVNSGRTPPAPPDHVVLLVKGELLRRFPNTIVSAVEAVVSAGERTLGTNIQMPIFTGRLDPDLAFFGFDLQPAEARSGGTAGEGWFFVLAEHPTEPRFGLDAPEGIDSSVKPTAWENLSWAHTATDPRALAGLDYLDLNADLPDTSAIVTSAGDPPVAWHADRGLGPAGAGGADLAWITLRRPFRVAIHGSDLLPDENHA